ncbi:MAG: type I-MYXAN CRISPR-associated protein Cas6/Cmx6 [Thiotrichales bacterium]
MNTLFWQEEKDEREPYRAPENVLDVSFKVDCRMLPIDHAQALSDALRHALPWLPEEPLAAVHTIHVAESGNGWIRPEDVDHDVLYLSRRTRLTVRVPVHRVRSTCALAGTCLDIAGNTLVVGEATVRKLVPMSTVFSRYVIANEVEDESRFLDAVYRQLLALGIRPRKMMPGKQHTVRTDNGPQLTRSLMLAELQLEESVLLQEHGIGPGRQIGCGIFLPHKGIEAVGKPQSSA